jgi:SAM-dependent methyltransferase
MSQKALLDPQEVTHQLTSVSDARCLMGSRAACDFERLNADIDRSGIVPDVSVKRCRSCGMGITEPPLSDVSFLYADRTSQDFQPNTRGLARLIKQIAFRQQARRLLGQVHMRPRTVIDFACGSGLFTSCLAATLPRDARLIACDFHSEPPADLDGVEYRSLKAVEDLDETADLVLAMHVLEHDDDPRKLLDRIVRLAKPGGKIIIEVPNIDCVWIAIFGRWWDAWYLPYHRTHFSRESLRALVESSKLKIVTEANVSVPTMGRSLANLVRRRNSLAFIVLGAVCHPLQWFLEWLTNRPVAIRVIALKL